MDMINNPKLNFTKMECRIEKSDVEFSGRFVV